MNPLGTSGRTNLTLHHRCGPQSVQQNRQALSRDLGPVWLRRSERRPGEGDRGGGASRQSKHGWCKMVIPIADMANITHGNSGSGISMLLVPRYWAKDSAKTATTPAQRYRLHARLTRRHSHPCCVSCADFSHHHCSGCGWIVRYIEPLQIFVVAGCAPAPDSIDPQLCSLPYQQR